MRGATKKRGASDAPQTPSGKAAKGGALGSATSSVVRSLDEAKKALAGTGPALLLLHFLKEPVVEEVGEKHRKYRLLAVLSPPSTSTRG